MTPQTEKQISPSRRIMRWPEVKAAVGFGRTHVDNLIKQGRFPKPRRIGVRAVGWDSSEIEEYVRARLAQNSKVA